MNEMINVDMSNYWNGDGGRNWVRFQDRMDASLNTFGQKTMATAAIIPGEKVLDIGCGCGDTSYEIANLVAPSGYVRGIDFSEIILQQARCRTSSIEQHNISFECVDAQLSLIALMEPPMFGIMEPLLGCDSAPQTG